MNNLPTTNDKQYLHTFGAGAFLPLMQSTISALIVTLAVWLICWMVFGMMDPHKPAIFIGVVVWLWMWWKLQLHWFALTAVNMMQDFMDDGQLNNSNQPEVTEEAPRRVVTVRLVRENGRVSDTFDLPGGEEAFRVLATGLVNGLPLSERWWTGRGKPYGSETWRDLMDVMRERGLAEYKDPEHKKRGHRLTPDGEAFSRGYAALPHSPIEEDEG